ncbi:MAG: PAS domain S-box protein [Alphaproteobacteria bacterium]|nr:PAS domain S-box protein [Alphaproteobacteria bacterium]
MLRPMTTTPNLSFFTATTNDPRDLSAALRESHELLALAEQSAGIGIWDRDLATDLVRATPTFFRLMGLEPSTEPVHPDVIRAVRHPDDAAQVVDGFHKAVASGQEIYDSEYRIIRPSDGQMRWIFGRGRVVRDASGKPVRYSGVDIDVTERKRIEGQLRETEERFSKAFNAAAHPMSITTLKEGRFVDINAAGLRASGLSREQVIGRTVRELGFYGDPESQRTVRELLAKQGRFTDLETVLRNERGSRTYLLSGSSVELRGEQCLMISAVDITERKKAEEENRLLMHEVNHRANNLLAVIQAIARQTVDSGDPRNYAERLSQRIAGIAASNNLLVSGNWHGVALARLVESQLAPFAESSARLSVEGPSVKLAPAAAQAVGMALHELATNAAKYGALSRDGGRIRIAWSVTGDSDDDRIFSLGWSEQGGPAVVQPERRGFGTTVIERMVSGTLGGKATLEFAPPGVIWTFACPVTNALELGD